MLERHGSLESCRSVGPCARADVGAWPRVCACPSRGRCRAKVGGGPCYARRGPPRPTAPRFARSGSTLKRGIYRGDSFCLRSCPLPFPLARTVLPLSLRGRGHHVGRGALLPDDLETRRMEGLSRESNPIPKPVYSVSEGILFTRYARIRKILRLIRRLLGRGRYIECHRAIF